MTEENREIFDGDTNCRDKNRNFARRSKTSECYFCEAVNIYGKEKVKCIDLYDMSICKTSSDKLQQGYW